MSENKILIKLLFSLSAIVILQSWLYAQPETVWTKTFGGSDGDECHSIQQTSDGGYILTGYYGSFLSDFKTDALLIKIDASGDTTWTKTFGGSEYDYGYSVQQTSDGGYIITGNTGTYGPGEQDVWLIKTDASGDTLWTKTFGGEYGNDEGRSVQQTSDGGYIISGYTYFYGTDEYDVLLIKTDASGDTVWTKTFGGSDDEYSYSVQQTSDGGYIITGNTRSYGQGSWDVWLIKTDASGDTTWTKTFGGSDGDYGYSVQQTSDGGYIITGSSSSYHTGLWDSDVWLIKTDASGDTVWTKNIGGELNDEGQCVRQTSDGGYIIIGSTASYGAGNYDVWIIKTNALGDTTWTKTFGGVNYDEGFSVQQTADEGYIITGRTASYGAGGFDVWLIRLEPYVVGIGDELLAVPQQFALHQNYPNPFNPVTTLHYDLPENSFVNITIYNMLGRKVRTLFNQTQDAGYKSVIWNATNDNGKPVSAGVYLYQIKAHQKEGRQAGEFVQIKKMVLLK
ncbi:MAG: T9SS type A sorting domain-containing protein [Candidatus Marinimicrobia bacterium]|nr:T9SS type A sorting domain-containing protein [Candidatus Neomarinimicrobiota bacterium]